MSAATAETALRVVIVDDTPDLRDLLRMALEGDGFDVVAEAGDGRQGIEVAQRTRPDVILLDLAMPVMDGLEALPTLRQVCPEAKIIVLSGFGAAQMTRRAMAAGADGYLQKGLPLKTILGYVRDLTDQLGQPPPRLVTVAPAPAQEEPAAASELPDAVRLAPFGVIEVLDEPVYRVVIANDAAVEVLGRPCPSGTPLFSLAPLLASMITLHRAAGEASFEFELPAHRVSAVLRRTGNGRLLVYLVPADETLRRQVATTAHELRGPITTVIGLVETLQDTGTDDPERTRLLDAVHRQARLLDGVTADLLTEAQAQRGQHRVTSQAMDPEAFLRPLLGKVDGHTLEVTDERHVLADPRQLEQMVTNLLTNAQKYGRSPYTVRVRPAADPGAVCIDVVDQGSGVPPEFVDRLFQEFSRAEGTDVGGTGLGLYIVRTLATAQGGEVGYAAGPDGGAVFTLTLPARSQ